MARASIYPALVVGSLLAIYLAVSLLPGDAATQELGLKASPEAVAALRTQMGLDQPVLLRFGAWVAGVLQGDLGTVASSGVPVPALLTGPATRSALLAVIVAVGIAILGVGGGIAAGTAPGSRLDRIISSGALTAICTPEFVLGTALVFLFATKLNWFPAVSFVPPGGSVFDRPEVIALPAVAIVLVGSGALVRQVRSIVEQQVARPHIEAARLAGLTESHVVRRHVLPGAAPAIAQSAALVVPYVIGGTVVVERVFGYPGLGSVLVMAVTNRDVNVLMGCALVLVTISVFGYAGADAVARRTV